MRFPIFLVLFFSVFPALSSDVCYQSDRTKKKLMPIFVANLDNDKLIDPDGTKKLMAAIKDASAKKRYDLYEEAVNNLSAKGNASASLLKASIWLESGDMNKCLEAYTLLRELQRNTKNQTLANDLKSIVERKIKHAVKESRQINQSDSPVKDQALNVGDGINVDVDNKKSKSLILIFEN